MCFLKSLFQKSDVNKMLVLVYKDLAQPGVRKVGIAIKNILALLLFPVSDIPVHLAKKGKIILANNLQRFSEKLSKIPEDKIEEVPQELGVPIVQKLTYVQDEDISEMFINLLTKASVKENSHLAHPSFINCINNMSSDEAKILLHIKDSPLLPYVIIRTKFNEEEGLDQTVNLTGLDYVLELRFPKNVAVYIENLTCLGIITKELGFLSDEKKYYKPLYEKYEPIRKKIELEGHGGKHYPVEYLKGYYKLTAYGNLFITACLVGIDTL